MPRAADWVKWPCERPRICGGNEVGQTIGGGRAISSVGACARSTMRLQYSLALPGAIDWGPGPRARKGGTIDAAGLGRYRLRARLYRPVVRYRELRRPNPAFRAGRPLATLHLSALARDLLHVVDLLRVGGARLAHRLRFPDDLCRS